MRRPRRASPRRSYVSKDQKGVRCTCLWEGGEEMHVPWGTTRALRHSCWGWSETHAGPAWREQQEGVARRPRSRRPSSGSRMQGLIGLCEDFGFYARVGTPQRILSPGVTNLNFLMERIHS